MTGLTQSDGTSDARGVGDKFAASIAQDNQSFNEALHSLLLTTNKWLPLAVAGGLAQEDLSFNAHGVYFSGPACMPFIDPAFLSFLTGKRPDFQVQRERFNTDPGQVQANQGFASPDMGDREAIRWFHNPN